MKKTWTAIRLMAVLLCMLMLSGCTGNTMQNRPDHFKKAESIGQVPEAFRNIVAQNMFHGAKVFDGRLLKTETVAVDEQNRTATHRVWMMDLYGETMAEYVCSADDACYVDTLTATKDGGFLFVLGFEDYAYDDGHWASDKGVVSRIVKCDKDGKLQFDLPLDHVKGAALNYCFEKDGYFYFFGAIETPETDTQGVWSPTDIYMLIIDAAGTVVKSQCIAGSDYDSLSAAEMSDDGFVLTIHAQSDDGDFVGSGSGGYPVQWLFTVNDDLKVTGKEKESELKFPDKRIGEKDGVPVYPREFLLKGFDAGSPTIFLDYGHFYLIVSENITGIYENTPPMISSIWYYTENVYSAYDVNGKIIFRATVDSSPDYDAWQSNEY
ncbi:MAG: hypothetical protein IJY28_10410 [Clostridia bacterium]|nr:hypothetical protein [Clostridia bacterium]